MRSITSAGPSGRSTTFAPRLQALLDDHRGEDVFRLEPDTVGVAGPDLMDRILGARPATEVERPTFKPLLGRSITRNLAATMMQAVGRDVRVALKNDAPTDVDLSGNWPHVGHVYLRDLILGADPVRFQLLMNRALELTPKLTSAVIAVGAALPGWPQAAEPIGNLASVTAEAAGYRERRFAMGMYRRTAAPVCFTISTLVANALWLGAPFRPDVSNRNILWESMRLLPPSWNMLRNASPEYPIIDSRIGEGDDVLVLPLVSHRDPENWDAPDEFRPERWNDLDPENTPGYLPFGHVSERCWGRHMVMPLAEMLLGLLRDGGFTVDPTQREGRVLLTGLLGVQEVRVIRATDRSD
ncbi:cytochrome P450 [Micromonospora sp. WMMD710]|uniref:cytochrome P450 n=1 Tax=Micromonospora sp. WMMD710 TaxID=3016085 RepID=UPI002417746C|nr:cytochrome P450 [Micromonospora sp. WMMD710]MDG4759657.1 cytochrome P450 [Micromonospora sp. WMMD710]